jgi:hypothetical protein
MNTASQPHAVSLFDARPFFEKALVYGVQHGILDQTRLDTLCSDAPKGMVQIARYFGTEFLAARNWKKRVTAWSTWSASIWNTASGGDLRGAAAESLRDHSSPVALQGRLGHA